MKTRIPATVLRDDAGTIFEIENFADRVLLTATATDRVRATLSLPLSMADEIGAALLNHTLAAMTLAAQRAGGAA